MLKSLNFTKRKTKLYTKTPHAVAPFVLVGVASEIIVSISSKVKIINFYTRSPSCRAIKISCTVIKHGRALLSCKRNSRGTIRPIRKLVYVNWILKLIIQQRHRVYNCSELIVYCYIALALKLNVIGWFVVTWREIYALYP